MYRIIFVILLYLLSNFGFGQTIKYTSVNLNMRDKPSTSGNVLIVIPNGTAVTMRENCDCQWILVSYNNKIGYVSSKYLVTNAATVQSSGSVRYYTNSRGVRVQSPTHYNAPPAGATALCRNGTYSFSRNRRGTCSGHGGVARWL